MKDYWKTFGAVFSFILLIGLMVYVHYTPDTVLNQPLPPAEKVGDGLKENFIKVYNKFLGGEDAGEPSGVVVNPDGGAYWGKTGIGLIEWDKFTTESCSATRYLNITSYLSSQDLDVCVRTNRPLANSYSDAWVKTNMSHDVLDGGWINITTQCFEQNNSLNGCVEQGYANQTVIGVSWFIDWFNIKDKFTHYSYNGNDFYCLKNVYAEQNRKYELKLKMAFPYFHDGIMGCEEKFGLVAKRSSESLSDALSLNHYVELDPVFSNSDGVLINLMFNGDFGDSASGIYQGGENNFTYAPGGNAVPLFRTMTGENLCQGQCWVVNTSNAGSGPDDGAYYNDTGSLLSFYANSAFSVCESMMSDRTDGEENNIMLGMVADADRSWYTILKNNYWRMVDNGVSSDNVLNATISANTWFHYCVTYDGSTVVQYFNGVRWSESQDTYTVTTKLLSLNIWPGSGFEGFNHGMYDNFIYANITFTDSDISTIYSNNGLLSEPNAPSNPVVEMSPLDSFSNVDIYCDATINDTDVETDLTACVDLLKNNASQEIICGLPITNNVDFNYTITAVGNFTAGDEWGCGVLIDDQTANSSWVNNTQNTVIQNQIPICTGSSNITIEEDSGGWVLVSNMSINLADGNITCSDAEDDALTYTEIEDAEGRFTNNFNDNIGFTTLGNGTGTYIGTYDVNDSFGGSTRVSAQVIVTDINDNLWWDGIGNNSGTKIKTGFGYQPIDINASQYFRDVEDNQTPSNITISTNETSVDCYMDTASNFSVFCKPDSVSVFIITLNGSDSGGLSELTSFEEYVAYPPSAPVITLPIATTYHGNNTLAWTASVSPQGDEIAFYNLTINFGPVPYTDWYYWIAEMNSTSYSWDFREIRDDSNNEYYLQVDVCDNNSLCTYGLSAGFSINNTPHWDNIGNATALDIKVNLGKQPVLNNVSQYFHDYFDNQAPSDIVVDDNETGISCTIETNLSLFCTPTAFKGDYIILLNGTNSVGNSSFESFEGYVGNEPPTTPITLNPEDNALNDTMQLNLTCSGSTDIEGDVIYYDFLGDTSTIPTTSICLNTGGECLWNYTTTEQISIQYWSCAANDTYENSSFITPRSVYTNTYDIINQTQSSNDFLVSSDNIILESNVSWNEIRYKEINALANISGTFYTTTKTSYDNWTNFKVTIPFNQTDENPQGFTWNYTLTFHNDSVFENITYGGSISYTNLILMNCSSTNTSILLNVTGFNEDTNALLGISLEGIFEIWTNNYDYRNTQTFNLNATDYNVTDGIDSYYFCLSYDTPINLSSYMQYSTPGGFAQRWYINKQAYINNTNNEIHLYDRDYTTGINELKGTVRYKDSYSYFPNVYTRLYRYYPADNLWTWIQSDKSDEFGLVDFNIKEITEDYKILFYDSDNHLLLQTSSSKFTCDPTTTLCEITFLLDSWSEGTSTYKTPLSWSYDNATGIISVTWNDPTNVIDSLRVLVTKETMSGTTTVCNGSTSSASGTYTCNVSDYSGTLLLRAYQTASPESNALIWEIINRPINALFQFIDLKESVTWTISLSVTTALFGLIISPVAGIIMFITSLVIINFLGLAGFVTIGFITASVILGIIIGLKVRS